MKLAMARSLKQSPDTVTSMTKPDVGPADVAEMWHAEPMMWCLSSDPLGPQSNG